MRDGEAVKAIVEHKDANDAQRAIREIYTGMLAAPTAWLKRAVMALTNDNAQREYYLTDIVAMAVADGVPVVATQPATTPKCSASTAPCNWPNWSAATSARAPRQLMEGSGVRLADPARFDVRGTLGCGSDVEIDVGCVFEGAVTLADNVNIGAHCVIRDATIGAGAVIQPFTHIDGARIGAGAIVGPFARLRPGADLGDEVHIGNFVEVKNSTLARAPRPTTWPTWATPTVGERVNYGAGSITANYDGANKHRTVIGADVHVGSNCVLVAPITIGEGATIGGGSTIARDAPAGQLTLARAQAGVGAGLDSGRRRRRSNRIVQAARRRVSALSLRTPRRARSTRSPDDPDLHAPGRHRPVRRRHCRHPAWPTAWPRPPRAPARPRSGSLSNSLTGSSNSSSPNTTVAEGDYRVIEVAELAERPGMLRLQLQASGAARRRRSDLAHAAAAGAGAARAGCLVTSSARATARMASSSRVPPGRP